LTPLAGATFQVTFPDNSVYNVADNTGSSTCTTTAPSGSTPGTLCDTNPAGGAFQIDGLMTGTYQVKELTPPVGYLLPADNTPKPAVIDYTTYTGPVDVGTFADPLGSVTWTKFGPDGSTPLAGATFQVTFPDNSVYNVVDGTSSTTCAPQAPDGTTPGILCDTNPADGQFELDGLMTGTYTIVETVPPTGYLLPPAADNHMTATIDYNTYTGPVSAGSVTDPLGAIKWTKYGPDGTTPLGGATFLVTGPNGYSQSVVDDGTFDANKTPGQFEVDGLKTGAYTITETAPPPGYLMPPGTQGVLTATIGVNDNTGAVPAGSVTDPLGAIKWTKFGPDGHTPLGGATFQVTGPNSFSETVVDNGANDANKTAGLFEVDGLMTGDYTITETAPPPGYLLPTSGNPLHVTIGTTDNTGPKDAGSLTDPLASIEWRKLNKDTGGLIPVAGTKFTLVATAGPGLTVFHYSKTVVDNGTNDADSRKGYIKVVNVPTGTYTITEIAAPTGFMLPTTGRSITGVVITDTSTTTVNAGAISDPPYLPQVRPGHPTLPDTGGPDLGWFILGGGLLAGGLVLMVGSKYRRNHKA
jgi:uncharacterized surface anchored protein